MMILLHFEILLLLLGVVFSSNFEAQDDFPFTSVVDILSQNVEFSTFLRAIQRQGYIPYLNELQNYTLFAPVNSAFIEEGVESEIDIQNYLLHNTILPSSDIDDGIHVISENVKFPFILERTEDDLVSINNATIVDPDLSPNFQKAIVHGIAGMLSTPPEVEKFLGQLEKEFNDFHFFNNFIRNMSPLASLVLNRTLLLPSDANFRNFYSDVEINYIIDVFGSLQKLNGKMGHVWYTDRQRFFQNIILEDILGGFIENSTSSQNLNGKVVNFESNQDGSVISANGSISSDLSNMLFSRGIAHAFNNLRIISNVVQFNAEKYLHGLNCTNFVKELYFRNLQHLILDGNLGENLTIFVPTMPADGSDGFSKPNLLYHFAGDEIRLDKEFAVTSSKASKMFESEYCDSNAKLGRNCQRIKITKDKNEYYINEKCKIGHKEPYQVGKTLIYMISENLKLPGDLASSINPFYGCSSSLMFLNQLGLLDLPLNGKGYTILLPCFNSWESLELNLEFFQKNATAINLMMKNMIFDGLIYSDFKDSRFHAKNLLGESITVKAEHGGCDEDDDPSLELSSMKGKIKIERSLDLFFNQGVVHPLKQLNLPESVTISLKDLIRTAGSNNLIGLLEKFEELSSIVNNNEPYSILVPTASSLIGGILNSTKLIDFLKLHVIPGKYTSGLLNCCGNVSTALGDKLTCRRDTQGNQFLKVSDGSQNEVRILKKGCTSFHDDSCVFLIDRPISLQWLNHGKSRLRLPHSPLAIGIVVETVVLIVCLAIFLYRKRRKPAWQLINPSDDADITRPLVEPSVRDAETGAN
ncbi:YLR001C [Zygosaccharomyces parabailii]|uniref:BN860_08768g1_1 n=1 Tax=Zygosaccharomyces bailii (strain CLIB 213 / ATCC 58445 / CBS 680 / BCRC 21525 / NBRC 1098 / NCYC 1416 / NRRL Y-2227) TaxID=1333698 RepID=A0A8J2X969_ZYGB2|nr:YLR001C [Zygosaccharomyces parabailii]CDF88375.1 BN860_08768g1_1 [Zygosaccharomyces bailii CLIB 213]CDH14743.1 uncharacterized protein ZBAI_06529 [Zygosaccharomyces bailii ISA1307]